MKNGHLPRLVCVALILVMIVAMAGCTGNGNSNATAGSTATAKPSATAAATQAAGGDTQVSDLPGSEYVTGRGEFPVVKEPITLEVAIMYLTKVENYYTNWFTQYMEDKTGISLEFIELPSSSDDAKTKVNLMFASNELPDMITGMGFDRATIEDYALAGWIQPIDEYIDAYGDGWEHIVNRLSTSGFDKLFDQLMTFSDGHKYTASYISCGASSLYRGMCWVYQPWMDTLGLDHPTTLDEFYDMCVAFRDLDPNGNGVADEWAISGDKGQTEKLVSYIGGAFQYTDPTWRLAVNNGVVEFIGANDEYKKTIEFIKKMYDEGLIDPQMFTQDAATLKTIMAQDDLTVGCVVTQSPSGYMVSASEPMLDFFVIGQVSGPDGFAKTFNSGMTVSHTFIITKACEYPAAAYRWVDYVYLDDTAFHYGEKGVHWDDPDPGSVDPVGSTPVYKMIDDVINYSLQNTIWGTNNVAWLNDNSYLSRQLVGDDAYREYENKKYVGGLKLSQWDADEYVPASLIYPSADDEIRATTLFNDVVKIYLKEQTSKFIVGDRSLDTWDAYVSELNAMGIDEYVELMQAAYDLTMGK